MTHPLRTYGLCEGCQQPAHTDGSPGGPQGGRGWIHTETGTYRCPPGGHGDGFVLPMPGTTEDMLSDARNEGYEEGYEEGRNEGYEEGERNGRTEMHAELKVEVDKLSEDRHVLDDVLDVFRDVQP